MRRCLAVKYMAGVERRGLCAATFVMMNRVLPVCLDNAMEVTRPCQRHGEQRDKTKSDNCVFHDHAIIGDAMRVVNQNRRQREDR